MIRFSSRTLSRTVVRTRAPLVWTESLASRSTRVSRKFGIRIGFSPLRRVGPIRWAVDGFGVRFESHGGVGAARPKRIRLVDQLAMLEAVGVESTLESDRAAVMLVARRAATPSVNRKPVNRIER